MRIKRPFEILNQEIDEGPWPLHQAEMFDPARTLTTASAGVIPKRRLTLVYATYDPAHVPEPVLASWGDEPLPALTWAEPFRAEE